MIRDAQKNGLTSQRCSLRLLTRSSRRIITDARTELIEHMKDQFETAVSKGHLDCTDAAALYTLTMAEKYSDWTAENIKDYFQIIKLNAETTATMVGKEPDEVLLDKVDTVPKTNKSKDKSDNEKIADFLREIGL